MNSKLTSTTIDAIIFNGSFRVVFSKLTIKQPSSSNRNGKGNIKTSLAIIIAALGLTGGAQTLTINRVPADIITWTGETGTQYVLQTSTNLTDWLDRAAVTGDGLGKFAYTNFPGSQKLFYRTSVSVEAFLTLDPASPLASTVAVSDTVNNQYLGLPVLVFDVVAQNSILKLDGAVVRITSPIGGSGGSLTAAYLYQGATLIATSMVVSDVAVFTNIFGAIIPANTAVPYVVKVDVCGVGSGPGFTVAASVSSSNVVVRPSDGGIPVPVVGSATGNIITVVGTGAMIDIAGTPTITKQLIQNGENCVITATFNVLVGAVGENITLGLPGSSCPSFLSDASFVSIWKNGTKDSFSNYQVVVIYAEPQNTADNGDGTFVVARNQIVTIPVTFTFVVPDGGMDFSLYAVELDGVKWIGGGSTNKTTLISSPRHRTPSI